MILAHLALTDFRNFATSAIVLTPGLTIIEGKNGQGKSNLLEAAFVFGALHPLRARSTRDLVRFGAGGFRLQGTVDGEARAFAVTGDGERWRLFAGDVLTTAGRWVPWGLRPVAFLPEDVALAAVRDRESRAGVWLVGPHRDEVQLLVAGEDARRFASRGTQRTRWPWRYGPPRRRSWGARRGAIPSSWLTTCFRSCTKGGSDARRAGHSGPPRPC